MDVLAPVAKANSYLEAILLLGWAGIMAALFVSWLAQRRRRLALDDTPPPRLATTDEIDAALEVDAIAPGAPALAVEPEPRAVRTVKG